jgi:predicted RNA-binding protein YlxR (DUF448 family)
MNDTTSKPKQIRMCVVCKKRDKQKNLIRLQCINGNLSLFSGKGRSFYVCKECVNNKKFYKILAYKCNFSKIRAKEEIKKIFGLDVVSDNQRKKEYT